MGHLIFFSFTFFLLFHQLKITLSVQICKSWCGPQSIQFPFMLNNQPNRCGYPGFNLTCNSNQNQNKPIINLPNLGDFTIQYIDYLDQTIYITDPSSCIAQRFINSSFNDMTSGSTFALASSNENFTLVNCSSPNDIYLLKSDVNTMLVECLSKQNYTILVVITSLFETVLTETCNAISTFLWTPYTRLSDNVMLKWVTPDCRVCRNNGGICQFESDVGLNIGCSNLTNNRNKGSSGGVNVGLYLMVGLPVLFILGNLVYCIICACLSVHQQQQRSSNEFPISIDNPQVVERLDSTIIESYPKTTISENGGKSSKHDFDKVSTICLCEYEDNETLRIIPKCNHYFHVDCIDSWLKVDASCPICRNNLAQITST